jgi:predicted amidohydrolase
MRHLTVTCVQCPLAWEDPAANRAALDRLLEGEAGSRRVVLLPEMFTTGFTMNARPHAEAMDGPSVRWLSASARRLGAAVAGSLVVREDGRFYNRFVWAEPDGSLLHYDKRHRFRMAGEHEVYAAGDRLLTVAAGSWRIRCFVCYDLRFPVWCRNTGPSFDLAVFVANWPARRAAHWRALLVARAIENQCYVAGVNRVGTDGNGVAYSGGSMVVDPAGDVLWEAGADTAVHTVTLDMEAVSAWRRDFPAWMDADADRIRLPESG